MTTLLQTHSLTHTSLVLPSGTQPKPFSLPSTINLFLPSLINKSPVGASLIFLQPLTPSTQTYYSKDCLLGSVLPTLLSSGFRLIYLPALSPLKHQKPHRNHALSPQGSGLWPLLFIFYTTPLSSLIKASSVDHHLYADDTQLFISFSPSSFSDSIDHLLRVVKQISSWMTSNMLCLNPSKTEFILIGLREQLKKIPDPSISLDLDSVSTHTFIANSPVRNLGVTFDQNLSFSDHITHLSRSCFMHIRDLRRIRPMLDFKTRSEEHTSELQSQ